MSSSSDQWVQFYRDSMAGDPEPADYRASSCAAANGPSKPSTQKRRSRASRKAPTTLLNANTTNFRDLVQQFTGFHGAGASLPLRGPVNLSFRQGGRGCSDILPSPSVMVQAQEQQQQLVYGFENRNTSKTNNINVSRDSSSISNYYETNAISEKMTEDDVNGILMDDEEFSLHELAMEFSSNNVINTSTGIGNVINEGSYFF